MLATLLLVSPILYFERCLDSNLERAAVAGTSRRATNFATHLSKLSHPSPFVFDYFNHKNIHNMGHPLKEDLDQTMDPTNRR